MIRQTPSIGALPRVATRRDGAYTQLTVATFGRTEQRSQPGRRRIW